MEALAIKTARWLIVAVLVLFVLYRNRALFDRAHFARELVLVVGAYFAYFLVRGVTQGSEATALANADRVIAFERELGMLWEPWLQSLIIDHQGLITLMNWAYIWGHWPLIILVAIWLYTMHPETYRLYRNAFMVSGAIGLVIFASFPVAPPRLADIDVVDTVTLHSNAYRVLQPPSLVNQYAAVPSLHFGWNLLIGIAIVTTARSREMKAFGVVMPIVMLASVVLTANHYVVDPIAGAIVALAGFAIAWNTTRPEEYADARR